MAAATKRTRAPRLAEGAQVWVDCTKLVKHNPDLKDQVAKMFRSGSYVGKFLAARTLSKENVRKAGNVNAQWYWSMNVSFPPAPPADTTLPGRPCCRSRRVLRFSTSETKSLPCRPA